MQTLPLKKKKPKSHLPRHAGIEVKNSYLNLIVVTAIKITFVLDALSKGKNYQITIPILHTFLMAVFGR
jgi:hypothetical protein